jgi:hypothetical protein
MPTTTNTETLVAMDKAFAGRSMRTVQDMHAALEEARSADLVTAYEFRLVEAQIEELEVLG